MPREDNLSSRFDYLFEPLEDDESADDPVDADSPATDSSDDKKRSQNAGPVRMAFAAFVLATLAAAAVVAALLVQRPNEPVDSGDTPLEPAQVSTTVNNTTEQPGPAATASEIPAEAPQTIESGPGQLPAQEPPPTTSDREPEARVPNSPTTRAPISVAPETRPPFPNQGPQQGGPTEGDLVPGVGLPGPL